MLGVIPLSNFTADNVTLDQIRQAITIAEECAVLSFTNLQTNTTAIYRASPDFSEINVVVLPTGWQIQAATNDLMYGISNNKLYRYNRNLFQYDELFTFNPSMVYWMKNAKDRLIVSAKSFSVLDPNPSSPLLSINLTVFVFNFQTSLVKVGDIVINGIVGRGLDEVHISTSPQLTKFGFGYRTSVSNPTQIVARHVDYTQNKMFTLTFQSTELFFSITQQIQGDRELDFNDYFLVVRNSSHFNMSEPENGPHEVAYQFAGTQAVLLRNRDIFEGINLTSPSGNASINREVANFLKIFVDWNYPDKLIVLDLFRVSNVSYELVQYKFGSLS